MPFVVPARPATIFEEARTSVLSVAYKVTLLLRLNSSCLVVEHLCNVVIATIRKFNRVFRQS